MNKKTSSDTSAVANGEQLRPTPEFERLLRERFSPEGKEERIARSLSALEEFTSSSIALSPEQWKIIAEDDDILEQ